MKLNKGDFVYVVSLSNTSPDLSYRTGTIIGNALDQDDIFYVDYGDWSGIAKFDEKVQIKDKTILLEIQQIKDK